MNVEPQVNSRSQVSRRGILQLTGAAVAAASMVALPSAPALGQTSASWDKVFPKSNRVDHRKVTFKNRYGITLAADLYSP